MAPRNWLIVFVAALAANLLAITLPSPVLIYFSKPLIVISLFLYASSMSEGNRLIRQKLLPALAFSWLGDVFLMFETNNPIFFMLGLGSFLLAHIFYILYFRGIRKMQANPPKLQFLVVLLAGIYIVTLLRTLYPGLGDLKIPVILYAVVLGGMLISAFQAFPRPASPEARIAMAGAILFIVSDSLLAINRFYASIPQAGLLIMLSYGMAQAALVFGSVAWLRSFNNR